MLNQTAPNFALTDEANFVLNSAKKNYVLKQLQKPKVQKNFGCMLCYVQPTLFALIDLYGNHISLENLQNCLNSTLSLHYGNQPKIVGRTDFPHVKNISKKSGFFKPAIKLYINNQQPEKLEDFFEKTQNIPTSEIIKTIVQPTENSNLVHKFIHELCHTISHREICILKDGVKQPLDIYGTVLAQNSVFQIERSGICNEQFKIGENGKIVNYKNYNEQNNFTLLDEGVNEIITKEIIASKQFGQYLKQQNIKQFPAETIANHPRFCATANLFEAMFGDELKTAHFAGKSNIKNWQQIEIFGNFCKHLNDLEEDIYFNSSITYQALEQNKKNDAEFFQKKLAENFDELNQLLFNFMDNNDTIMLSKQFEKGKSNLPQNYLLAVEKFSNSFESIFNFVTPVYPQAKNAKSNLDFWSGKQPEKIAIS